MKILAAFLLAAAAPLAAHVGSPDVFFEGQAGPYKLLVTIRPPQVVPGVAEIEIRSLAADVRQIHIVPLRLTAAQQFAPVPDLARVSKDDPQFYTGSLWLMATGSWKVRVDVDGARGKGTLSVPVPALSTRVLGMQTAIGAILIPLGLLLVVGLVAWSAPACARRNSSRARSPTPRAYGVRDARCRRRRRSSAVSCGAAIVVEIRSRRLCAHVYKPLAARSLGGGRQPTGAAPATIPAGSIAAPTICCPTTIT